MQARSCVIAIVLSALSIPHPATADDQLPSANFARENLVAWCIVPFDASIAGQRNVRKWSSDWV